MRTPHLRVLALFVVSLLAFAGTAAAEDPRSDAKAHYVKGKALFDAKDYVNAIAEFKLADQIAPSAVNDYNIALAYDALGDESQAITFYSSYLKRMPDAGNKTEVQNSIKRLEAVQAAEADAARAAEEEARRRAEEERRMPPPVEDPPVEEPVGGVSMSTGDAELDRVAGVDINAIRDQRGGSGGTVAAAGGPPPPTGGGAPPPAEQPKKSKPIYKQWWFWVVAGVSAYVLISILASDSDSQPGARALEQPIPPMPDGFGAGGGASIWSF